MKIMLRSCFTKANFFNDMGLSEYGEILRRNKQYSFINIKVLSKEPLGKLNFENNNKNRTNGKRNNNKHAICIVILHCKW